VVTLGREADNDVVIPSPFVSRRHAVIERGPAGLVLAQDQPTNGSAVNGCKLDVGERHPLRAGDLFFLETEAFLLLEA
jgi:pSer/pThr/pTyr-binding forkhead associated (FHA) protein